MTDEQKKKLETKLWNIADLVKRHPDLFERILAKSTGALGEILVADQLARLGFDVKPTNNNSKQSDLLVAGPDGFKFSVEVKTDRSRRPTWFVRTRPDSNASAYWVFVSAPRAPQELPRTEDVQMFVLTTLETQQLWDSSKWNKANPTNGDIRRWQIPDDALDAWGKLSG